MEGLIQQQTEQAVGTYLLAASISDNSSFATKAIVTGALNDLKAWIDSRKKTAADAAYAGHLLLAGERMKAPEKARPTLHAGIPHWLRGRINKVIIQHGSSTAGVKRLPSFIAGG